MAIYTSCIVFDTVVIRVDAIVVIAGIMQWQAGRAIDAMRSPDTLGE